MERYDSSAIPLSPGVQAGEFSGGQLIFYDVDHSGQSFEGRVFINSADATIESPREPEHGYAGSFVIFGHGGCSGEEGHCEIPTRSKDAFDSRPLHALTPQTKTVDVGAALERVHADGESIVVTVLAIVPGPEQADLADVLDFSAMRLVTYA
jgi:hypothetical protein